MNNTELNILTYLAQIILILCLLLSLYFAFIRYRSTQAIISKTADVSFKILYHHSKCDLIISIWRLFLAIVTIIVYSILDGSNEEVIVGLNNTSDYSFVLYMNNSFMFVLSMSFNIHLKLKFSTYYEQNFKKFVLLSYTIPVIASLLSFLLEFIFKIANYAFINIFLLALPCFINITLLYLTISIWRIAKGMNFAIEFRKMVVIPLVQATILAEIIVWLVLLPVDTTIIYAEIQIGFEAYNLLNLLIFSLFPALNYFFYMRLNREELSKQNSIELDSQLEAALQSREEQIRDTKMLERAHDL